MIQIDSLIAVEEDGLGLEHRDLRVLSDVGPSRPVAKIYSLLGNGFLYGATHLGKGVITLTRHKETGKFVRRGLSRV